MKVRTKTIKGWANSSSYLFSQNSRNKTFENNLKEYAEKHLQGFKRIKFYETLKGKNASEKVIIKGWYWRGAWSDPSKEVVTIFYK